MVIADVDVDADELPLEVEEFLPWLSTERGRAANTIAAYRRDLTGYTAWLSRPRPRPRRASTRPRWSTSWPSGGPAARRRRASPGSSPRCACCTASS